MITKAPKGTKDILPQEIYKWHYMEDTIREITRVFGYREIRTPVFEHTELFERGVGESTDIVQKEMYTFTDKGGRSITLKPEGTAGAARAYIEHKLYADAQPVKMYYITPCYRYERPQAGRQREFHQFGVEVFGASEASVDVEVISLAITLLDRLGIQGLAVKLNSIGCPKCRPVYHEILRSYFSKHLDELCSTCQDRYESNPLRILDCKVEGCRPVINSAPHMLDYLCEECGDHFEDTQKYLNASGIGLQHESDDCKGLDYYTKQYSDYFRFHWCPEQSAAAEEYGGLVRSGRSQRSGSWIRSGLESFCWCWRIRTDFPRQKSAGYSSQLSVRRPGKAFSD